MLRKGAPDQLMSSERGATPKSTTAHVHGTTSMKGATFETLIVSTSIHAFLSYLNYTCSKDVNNF